MYLQHIQKIFQARGKVLMTSLQKDPTQLGIREDINNYYMSFKGPTIWGPFALFRNCSATFPQLENKPWNGPYFSYFWMTLKCCRCVFSCNFFVTKSKSPSLTQLLLLGYLADFSGGLLRNFLWCFPSLNFSVNLSFHDFLCDLFVPWISLWFVPCISLWIFCGLLIITDS